MQLYIIKIYVYLECSSLMPVSSVRFHQTTLFCSLTGVSPFAGENDRSSALNIRNYNVAFEESMFTDLCHEAKGFIIKLLVADRL